MQYSTWGQGKYLYYQALVTRRADLEKELGQLEWSEPVAKKTAARPFIAGSVSQEHDGFRLADESTWPACQAWMVQRIEAFDKTLDRFVEQIPDYDPDA